MLGKTSLAVVSSAALAAAWGALATAGPAHAAVTCAAVGGNASDYDCFTAEDGDESKLFEIKADGVTTFFNQIGGNGSVMDVQTDTNVPVDTSNGYGEVKPSTKGDAWTMTTFSPVSTSTIAWDGLFVRGQIVASCKKCTYDGDLFVTVNGVDGSSAEFEFMGLPTEADFGTLGVDEIDGTPGVAIASITFSLAGTDGIFKSMKQFDVSNCLISAGCTGGGGPPPPLIPEPSTWAMMLLGFAGLGFVGYRKAKSRPAVAA